MKSCRYLFYDVVTHTCYAIIKNIRHLILATLGLPVENQWIFFFKGNADGSI